MKSRLSLSSFLMGEHGIGLIELLVTVSLLGVAMAAITGMLISGMTTQQKIDTELRAQLDAREAIHDMEKNLTEAKRQDANSNRPIFQDDMVSFPSQQGTQWITYIYANPSGSTKPTILRRTSNAMPTLPITIATSDKQMINVSDNGIKATVDRIGGGAIFTYFGASGAQIATDPVTHSIVASQVPSVRSIKVTFQTTASEGHTSKEPSVVSTQIDLHNF